jgi:DNA (cytosine-5)-methyltransferase 1
LKNNKKYNVGGLFSGVGGIELGFQKAGFNIQWANEFDSRACITYRENFKNHNLMEEDIWKLVENKFTFENKKINNIDILVGGFPCQAFSVAGYRKGFEDERGNLFFAIKEFIMHFQPKAILLENVKNLKGHDGGRTFGRIFSELDELGYSVIEDVLNTSKYTEIPQNRERMFIVGFKDESDWNNKEIFRKKESICSQAFSFPEKSKVCSKVTDLILDVDVDEAFYYTKEKSYMFDMLIDAIDSRETLYQWRRKYVRENKSNLCPTLTANMGTGGHNVPLILDYKNKIRKLTPRECFSFQGYDKKFKLPDLANSHLYKQAGNSVTVPLIEKIAKNIEKALDIKY